MFAIAFLFFILLYLLFSYFLAVVITKLLEVEGSKKRIIKLIIFIFIFMIGIVMWDWLPMEISYKTKCDNEAGLTIHKTLEQWKRENPGVWKTLSRRALPEEYLVKEQMYEKSELYKEHGERYYQLPDGTQLIADFKIDGRISVEMIRSDGSKAYWLNQRFAHDYIITSYWFHIYKQEKRIIDLQTNETLIKYIDFKTNIKAIGLGTDKLSDYKFWMQKNSCKKGMWLKDIIKFNGFLHTLKNTGSNE